MKDIVDYLAEKLETRKINQSEFARRAGLSNGPVSKWMRHQGKPDLESCLKIAAFFRDDPVKVLQLAGREDLVELYQKFDLDRTQFRLSEEDLYENERHQQLHSGLQRVLERGIERPDDVEMAFDLVRRTLDALQGSERLFRNLIERAQIIAWQASSSDHRFTYIAPPVENVIGFSQEACYAENFWLERLYPEDRATAIGQREEAARQGRSYQFEYRMLGPEGEVLWLQEVGGLVPQQSAPLKLQGFLFDVTPRKTAEEALRESEERYRSLVELCPDAIVVHRNGKILYVNPAAVKLHGADSAEDLVGSSVYEFVRTEDLVPVQERIRQNVEEGITMPLIKQEIVTLTGERIPVEVAAAPVIYRGEAAVQSILRNLSRRRAGAGARSRQTPIPGRGV